MKFEVTKCDNCGVEERHSIPRSYGGGNKFQWIITAKSRSDSDQKLAAGECHFCQEACLQVALDRPKPKTDECPFCKGQPFAIRQKCTHHTGDMI